MEWLTRDYLFSLIETNDYKDIYEGYSDGSGYGDEHYFDSKETAFQWADEIIDVFNSFPSKIKIYRAIYAENIESIMLDDMIGSSWSWERDAALEFGLHNGSNYLLSGEVRWEDVDWKASVFQFVRYSFDIYNEEAELELYIPYSRQVNIQNVRIEEIIRRRKK